jgi:hypothetical protein
MNYVNQHAHDFFCVFFINYYYINAFHKYYNSIANDIRHGFAFGSLDSF